MEFVFLILVIILIPLYVLSVILSLFTLNSDYSNSSIMILWDGTNLHQSTGLMDALITLVVNIVERRSCRTVKVTGSDIGSSYMNSSHWIKVYNIHRKIIFFICTNCWHSSPQFSKICTHCKSIMYR